MNIAMNPQSLIVTLMFLFSSALQFCASKKEYFDAVPKELRCSGCELTVKVLNQMLKDVHSKDLDSFIDHVLKELCDERRFAISEYKAESVVATCKFMKDQHGQELKQELIKHYSKSKKSTYMDLSQQICLNVMRLCPGHAHRKPDVNSSDQQMPDDMDEELDPESMEHFDHFLKVSGFGAKIAKPVPAHSHDEL